MTLKLTKEVLASAYTYLTEFKPFDGWNLPPAEDVKFGVIRKRSFYAHYFKEKGVHTIEVSSLRVGSHECLLATMSHEMIHLHFDNAKIIEKSHHGAAFQKYADRVCKIHGFDRLTF